MPRIHHFHFYSSTLAQFLKVLFYSTAAAFHCVVCPWVVKFCVTLEYCVELYDKVGGGGGVDAVGPPTLLLLIEMD